LKKVQPYAIIIPMAYNEKYRIRAVEYRKEGHTIKQTCKTFKIGSTTLKTWIRKYNETGEIKDKPIKRTFKKVDPVKLEAYIAEHPDAYLSEIAEHFACSDEAIRKSLERLKIARKKRRNVLGSRIPIK